MGPHVFEAIQLQPQTSPFNRLRCMHQRCMHQRRVHPRCTHQRRVHPRRVQVPPGAAIQAKCIH